jgi:hypothetical protein
MGALDRAQRALSNAPPLSRDHRKPSHCVTCEGLRSWQRRGEMIPQVISPPRLLQPAAHGSPCILVPRGCTKTALTRWVQVAGVREAARAPAAGYSRQVRPGYGPGAPPSQPHPRCECLPAALSGCVGCRWRLLVRAGRLF